MKKPKSSKRGASKAADTAAELNSNGDSAAPSAANGDFLVVGIGASAGGVQALKDFFENVPGDSGIAYVVILHLSPNHDSQLASILQNVAQVQVTQVTQQVEIEPNHVYVVPPNQSLKLFDGSISVSPINTVEERRAPVDIFFRTLAETHQARAVAVILSGTGANGSMGIKRVKERGGVAFVQNPREAEFSEMPRNSIATDLIDAVLNVGDIPARIIAYKESLGTVEIPVEPQSRPEEQQQALREIFTQMRVRTGHDFSNYKRATVLRRIERRINVHGLPDLPAYAAFIREVPEEAQMLLKDLLISVTNFFRDKEAFVFLASDVLPSLLDGKKSRDQLRLWVAGCATGEEAYSLAMLCQELIDGSIDAPSVQIFATDIDDDALSAAREGFYTLNDAADVSPERLRRFFYKEGDGFRIRREIREMVLFANHNLIKDPPFSHLDLATCRNLLIYLNHTAQERVMETLHFALNPGGYLFLGTSESIDGSSDLFAPVNKTQRIFQSRHAASRVVLPVPETVPHFRYGEKSRPAPLTPEQESRVLERISFGDLHQQLLEQYAAPSVVVNEEYDIVHLSERAGRYLQIQGGEPSKNLLKLILPELRLELRTALYQAVQRQSNVETLNLPLRVGDTTEAVNISIRPVMRESNDTARGFILVLFEKTDLTDGDATETVFRTEEPLARQLEEELMRAKSQLRSSVEQFEVQTEELRASNEELQALNEELRSAAEELETSKEELQSVNEELITVNQELKIKIEELSNSNNDFQNLMNSTDIGTIFLDRTLRVKMFTPSIRAIFNLIEADLNRPLADIASRLVFADLYADVENVMENLVIIEREVETEDGKWYLMRVFPYRTSEDRINGVVITFFNITSRKLAEVSMRESEARTRIAVEAAEMGTWQWDLTNDEIIWNERHFLLFGMQPHNRPVTPEDSLRHVDKDYVEFVRASLDRAIKETGVYEADFRVVLESGETRWMSGYGRVIETDSNGKATRMTGVMLDINARKQAEIKIRESEERLQLLIKNLPGGAAFIVDRNLRYLLAAGEGLGDAGFFPEDLVGKTISEAFPKAQAKQIEKSYRAALSGEPFVVENESRGITYMTRGTPLRQENGDVYAVLAVSYDITDRKLVEQKLRDSEERLRAMFEQASVGIVQIMLNGDLAAPNPGFCKIIGYNESETIRLRLRDITHPEDLRREIELTSQLFEGEIQEYTLEKRYIRKDQSVIWGEMTATLMRDSNGKPAFALAVVEDISERKTAEEALLESKERLRVIVESATDYAIITFATNNTIESWNAGAEKIFGWTEEQIIGRQGDILFTPVDRENRVPEKELITALEKGCAEDERWHIRQDGSLFFASGVMRPLLNGSFEGFVKIARDMTDKMSIEQITRDKEILSRIVVAQEDERKRVARDLHDHLGQQLTALKLKLENARKLCEDDEICGQIDEAQRLSKQIDESVDFLAWELRPASLDEFGLLNALEDYVKEWSRHSGIRAEFYTSGMKKTRLAPIAETNLYRIAQEAMNNIFKHASAQLVTVLLEKRGEVAILIIEDDGMGFDIESKLSKSKGLGLVGMRERAALVGGSVEIESADQRGTTVFARVPLKLAEKNSIDTTGREELTR